MTLLSVDVYSHRHGHSVTLFGSRTPHFNPSLATRSMYCTCCPGRSRPRVARHSRRSCFYVSRTGSACIRRITALRLQRMPCTVSVSRSSELLPPAAAAVFALARRRRIATFHLPCMSCVVSVFWSFQGLLFPCCCCCLRPSVAAAYRSFAAHGMRHFRLSLSRVLRL